MNINMTSRTQRLSIEQNDWQFVDDTFMYILVNQNARLSITILKTFAAKGPTDNKSAYVSTNGLTLERRQAINRINDEVCMRSSQSSLSLKSRYRFIHEL